MKKYIIILSSASVVAMNWGFDNYLQELEPITVQKPLTILFSPNIQEESLLLTTAETDEVCEIDIGRKPDSIIDREVICIKHKKKAPEFVKYAKKFLGTRYVFGGENLKRGIDCSAFTRAIIKKTINKTLPRTARKQASEGVHVDKKNLKAGDLVFFQGTSHHAKISHVGMMISKTKFIHASSGAKKITISSINKKYYRKHYFGARRIGFN